MPADSGTAVFATTVAIGSASGMLTVYNVVLAPDPDQAVFRLTERVGPDVASHASVGVFDPADPVALMLLSASMLELLARIAADSGSPLASGFELHVEHRMGR